MAPLSAAAVARGVRVVGRRGGGVAGGGVRADGELELHGGALPVREERERVQGGEKRGEGGGRGMGRWGEERGGRV